VAPRLERPSQKLSSKLDQLILHLMAVRPVQQRDAPSLDATHAEPEYPSYNLLFRWFLDMELDEKSFDHSSLILSFF
jgi:hypothetical protein